MALIALAADKGAPGVTTAAVALGAVWPGAVLLAECDPAGGDLAYRLPAADGSVINPAKGLLSLGAMARKGLRPEQVWEHSQTLVGGLPVLPGLAYAEQAGGLGWLWGPLGRALAALPEADVIADCGRLGTHPQMNDLLAEASAVVLVTRPSLEQVGHLRERVSVLSGTDGMAPKIKIVVIADPRSYRASVEEVRKAMGRSVEIVGALAYDPKGADMLRGEWGGRLDRSLLIRTARALAAAFYEGVQRPAHAVPHSVPHREPHQHQHQGAQ